MNNLKNLAALFGFCLILTSLLDAYKYVWQAQAIKKIGTAKGHSRKFINAALGNDIIKLSYGICIFDWFIVLSSLLALVTMSYNFYIIYRYYPYKNRTQFGFKRPHIFLYLINSILPNRIRKRL